MTNLLSIGECMVELAPRADGAFAMNFAGDTFNTAWYAARTAPKGLTVSYLSAVGDDALSVRMADFMAQAGITPVLARRPGRSVGLYMISLKDGERSFSYWRDTSAARSLADDLDVLPGLKAGDMAYFSGITMAILSDAARERLLLALTRARAAGVTVTFDPNLRPRLWPDMDTMRHWITRAAEVCDIALPSYEDEAVHFGDADPAGTADRYSRAGAGVVVVKNGAEAVLLRTPQGDTQIAPPKIAKVVDTTAAGDSFNAGFLVGILSGEDAATATHRACALAAQVVQHPGALVPV